MSPLERPYILKSSTLQGNTPNFQRALKTLRDILIGVPRRLCTQGGTWMC